MSADPTPADITDFFTNDCLSCLFEKSVAKDTDADYALELLRFLMEYLSCRMLTGDETDPCQNRKIRLLPQKIKDILDGNMMLATGGRLDLAASGIIHRIIEDDDWDR